MQRDAGQLALVVNEVHDGGEYLVAVNNHVMSFIVSSLEPTSTHFGVVVPFGTVMWTYVVESYTLPLQIVDTRESDDGGTLIGE